MPASTRPKSAPAVLVEATIERVVAGGFGLARTPDGVALIRGALPGERVEASLERKKGYLTGSATRILEAHPDRDSQPLPPGADLPVAYEAQIAIKEEIVREALRRVGGVDAPLEPLVPSPKPLGYRTAAQYGVVADGGLGAHEPASKRLIPIERDPLVAEPVVAAFDALASQPLPGVREVAIRASLHEQRAVVGLLGDMRGPHQRIAKRLVAAGVAGVAWGQRRPGARFAAASKVLAGDGELLEDFGGVLASVTVRSFAQVNPEAAGLLYRDAVRVAGGGKRAVDLYAGGGVLALHLAGAFARVDAIEISADAVKRGEGDARRLGAHGVKFRRGDARTVGRFLPADLVAVNPPRAGVGGEVLQALVDELPPRILYVSCDPPTWARDVGRLAQYGYRVTYARPFDFYPYTHHVEVLSLLETT